MGLSRIIDSIAVIPKPSYSDGIIPIFEFFRYGNGF